MASGPMWECECGNLEYGEQPPAECRECNTLGQFIRVPEDMVEEKQAEQILSAKGEEDED